MSHDEIFEFREPNVGTWNSSESRSPASEQLESILGRIARPFDGCVDCHSFFFLPPPFIDRNKDEHVKYYGLTAPSDELAKPLSEFISGFTDSFFEDELISKDTQLHVSVDRLRSYVNKLKPAIEEWVAKKRSRIEKPADSEDLVRQASALLLAEGRVQIGYMEITPEGPIRQSHPTLLDRALDIANMKPEEKSEFLRCLNNEHKESGLLFKSNRDFCDDFKIPDAPERGKLDEVILTTDGYLTKEGYVIAATPSSGGTLRHFIAEFLYSFGLSRIEATVKGKFVRIEDLRQTHLPLAALGQFRGSICWVSRTNRDANKCSMIVRKLDASFQALLSEYFAVALLEAFSACLFESQTLRGNREQYFRMLADAFGYVFYAYDVSFTRDQLVVATCRDGHVNIPSPQSNPSVDRLVAADRPFSFNHTPNRKGTDIALNLTSLLEQHVMKGTMSSREMVDLLGFDTVICRGMFVHDINAFRNGLWLVMNRMAGVLRSTYLMLNRARVLFSHAIGHEVKHVCTERGSRRIVNELESLLDRSRQGTSITLSREEIEKIIVSFRSEDGLFAAAEMFRRLDDLSIGKLPASWKGSSRNLGVKEILKASADALDKTVRRLAFEYKWLGDKSTRSRDGLSSGAELVLRRFHDGSKVPLERVSQPDIVGLRQDFMVEASSAIFAGLYELCRNAFQATLKVKSRVIDLGIRERTVWYSVCIDSELQCCRVAVYNYSDSISISSRSLAYLIEVTQQLRCIKIEPPRVSSVLPPNANADSVVIESIFELHPFKFDFRESD